MHAMLAKLQVRWWHKDRRAIENVEDIVDIVVWDRNTKLEQVGNHLKSLDQKSLSATLTDHTVTITLTSRHSHTSESTFKSFQELEVQAVSTFSR